MVIQGGKDVVALEEQYGKSLKTIDCQVKAMDRDIGERHDTLDGCKETNILDLVGLH